MTSHLALYRKYRPESFDDVVGQDATINLLKTVVKKGTFAHAYLFCGGRGTGKTSVARIFAREIGCAPEDIIEIDAASNRGIDEIRELKEAIRTQPFRSNHKVYIIDEVHMLTKEAANALLKTLEEPPEYIVFILATTDKDKLPHTIISRCQVVTFQNPTIDILKSRLQSIAKQEGKLLGDDEAVLIAKHGKGSFRDALGYLEQVLALTKDTVLLDDVARHLGDPEHDAIISLINAFALGDKKSVIEALDRLCKTYQKTYVVYDTFLETLRQILLARIIQKGDEELMTLGVTHANVINSALVLYLLEKKSLLTVSDMTSQIAFESILLDHIDKRD
ncbi:MAG: hypothetical protein RI935_126 [Candidatus Parcubacteria bacterium]|jgi:DNA polymerase-3 subunit gamma/tau